MIETLTALFLRVISNPLANVYQKKICAESSSLQCNFYTYFILGILCIPFATKINWTVLPKEFWIFAFTAGFLCSVGNACLVKALQIGELSVLGPINSYKCIVGMIVAIFVIHEIPTLLGLFGVVLIVWGSWFVFDTQKEGFSFALLKRKDILLRFTALFLMGIEAVFLKKVILLSSPVISFMLWCWAGAFFAFILMVLFKRNFTIIKKEDIQKYVIVCSMLATMQLTTNFVFKHMEVGYALALFQLSTLVNLWFGYKFFHESDMKKKLIGTIIMIIGSVTIILC
ncbi:EamA family transporter [bacterium]|nr:EamA family transporter [bacterium]